MRPDAWAEWWIVEDADDDISQVLADIDVDYHGEIQGCDDGPTPGMYTIAILDDDTGEAYVKSDCIFRNKSDAIVYLRKFLPYGENT